MLCGFRTKSRYELLKLNHEEKRLGPWGLCLADNHATRNTQCNSENFLFKAGLGLRIITLGLEDGENKVYKKIV